MQIPQLVHEIKIRNQVIFLDPPMEIARQEWLIQFQDSLSVICDLARIRSSRYEISLQVDEDSAEETTYVGIVSDSFPGQESADLDSSLRSKMILYHDPYPSLSAKYKRSLNTSTNGCNSRHYGI
jgi:hypothetical protein